MRLEYYCQICFILLPQAEQPLKFCPRCGQNLTETPPWFVERKHHHDIRGVAKHQRRLIWCILISVGFTMLMCSATMPGMLTAVATPGGAPVQLMLMTVLSLGVMLYASIEMILLMVALRWNVAGIVAFAIGYVIGTVMFSCFSLVMLLVLNGVATGTLKSAGLRVGLMGARSEDVERILDPYKCKGCGYSLQGNISGRCPECGAVSMLYPHAIRRPPLQPGAYVSHVTPPPPGREQ